MTDVRYAATPTAGGDPADFARLAEATTVLNHRKDPMTPPAPLTLEQVAASCPAQHYGVPVSWLGEDADGVAAFTTDRRRALAAMSRLQRTEVGERLDKGYDLTSLRFRWVQAVDHCGCQHADPKHCSAGTNGDAACCPVIPATGDYEAEIDEHDCPHHGLPPCTEDLYAWVTIVVAEGTPGALPMWQVHQ